MSDQSPLFHRPPDGHEFTDPDRLKEFILSGKAIFTLYSKRTTRHFTYKVKAKGAFTYWVLKRSAGGEWDYLGSIVLKDNGLEPFHKTRATAPGHLSSDNFKVFDWFWRILIVDKAIHPQLTVYHEGRCGTCGTALTDPESLRLGYGPECRKKKFQRPAQGDKVEA